MLLSYCPVYNCESTGNYGAVQYTGRTGQDRIALYIKATVKQISQVHRVNLHTLGFRSSSQRASASPSCFPSPQSASATGTEKPLVYDPHSRDALVISIRALSCERLEGTLFATFSFSFSVLRSPGPPIPFLILSRVYIPCCLPRDKSSFYTSVFLRTWDCSTVLPFLALSCLKEIDSQLELPPLVFCPLSLGICHSIPIPPL